MKRRIAMLITVVMIATLFTAVPAASFADEQKIVPTTDYEKFLDTVYITEQFFSGQDTVLDSCTLAPTADTGYLFEITPDGKSAGKFECRIVLTSNRQTREKALKYNSSTGKYQLAMELSSGKIYTATFIVSMKDQYKKEIASAYCSVKTSVKNKNIALKDGEVCCPLISYENYNGSDKENAYAIFEFRPVEEGYYEIQINNNVDTAQNSDLTVDVYTPSEPSNPEDECWPAANKTERLVKKMSNDKTYYIRIFESDANSIDGLYLVGLKVAKHEHSEDNKIILVDCEYVTRQCICNEYVDYEFWMEGVSFGNVTYTGKNVVPQPQFKIFYDPADVQAGIVPSIPAKDKNGKPNYNVVVLTQDKISVGTKKAKVVFLNEYEDLASQIASFKVVPKKTSLKSLTAAKKAFTVKWNKQATQTSGYQLMYSTSQNFKNAKTLTISGNKNISKKVSKLKAKTKYYVKIRTYKKVGNTKYCSAWSAAKVVTTK